MSSHVSTNPRLTQDNDDSVLMMERILTHSLDEVWSALTQAEQIPNWGPFTTDRDLTTTGSVRLVHRDVPEADELEGAVLEVNAPHLLVFQWGADSLRWELSNDAGNTLLILRHRFKNREQAPSYAAGWHLCLDGLVGTLNGEKMPSMVGHNAIKYGWQELYTQYAELFSLDN